MLAIIVDLRGDYLFVCILTVFNGFILTKRTHCGAMRNSSCVKFVGHCVGIYCILNSKAASCQRPLNLRQTPTLTNVTVNLLKLL